LNIVLARKIRNDEGHPIAMAGEALRAPVQESQTVVPLFLEDIAAGILFETPGRTITEADVVNFASLSGDFNLPHADEEFARVVDKQERGANGMVTLLNVGRKRRGETVLACNTKLVIKRKPEGSLGGRGESVG